MNFGPVKNTDIVFTQYFFSDDMNWRTAMEFNPPIAVTTHHRLHGYTA